MKDMAEYNVKPRLSEYLIPRKYHARIENLTSRGILSENNPETVRKITRNLVLVSLANLTVGGVILYGLIKLTQ